VHEKAGFHLVGRLRHVGFKFGQFIDVIIMQQSLDVGEQTTG
jgi:L-amino acid N-acyltransferase YncA